MKQSIVLLAFVVLIVICHAEQPSRKCRRELMEFEDECTLHCEYKHYRFTDDWFQITSDQRQNFINVMKKYGAITMDQERQLDEHLKKCAHEVNLKGPLKFKSDKCRKINQYYRCAVLDHSIFQYSAYAKAITEFEKTINI
uniref:SP15-like salivary protein n=1 Tax=Phlebotomus orientalis TaxID=99786 RepID=V5K5I3_PHLOR|nr:SP15-like salivary protein [Phlebotomus orientalis]